MRHSLLPVSFGTAVRLARPRLGAWVVSLGLLVVACSDDSGVERRMPQADSGRTINTRVFDCIGTPESGPFEFTVRLGPGELALWLPADFGIPYLVLAQDFDLAEATYREGDVGLRLGPDAAELSVGERRFGGCQINPVRSAWEHAKLSGVDFRATGSSPSWYLEIRNAGRLVFAVVDSSVRIETPTPVASTDESSRTTAYIADIEGQDLTVRISPSRCPLADGSRMQGSEAVVTWDGRDYAGCGRALH